MNAYSKGLLKVVSILFIIFGAISILILAIGLIGSVNEISLYGGLPGAVIAILIIVIITSASGLIIGIVDLKKCGNPIKYKFFISAGIILCALSLISLILSIVGVGFDFVVLGIPLVTLTITDLVLSVFLIIGVATNKKTIPPVE